jgi:hypothetical protein
MGMAKEIEDFLNGYTAVSRIAGDQADRKLREKKLKIEEDAAEAASYESLAIDPEEYLPGSEKARRRRAPPKDDPADPNVTEVEIIAPYGDDPGEVAMMASGGLVEAIPTEDDNPAAAQARARGDRSYRGSNGAQQPLYAAGGKPRKTYGDDADARDVPRAETGGRKKPSVGPGLPQLFASADKAIKAAMQGFNTSAGKRRAIEPEEEIDFRSGKGAATRAEITALDAKIDPDGEMSPWDRGRARLGAAYEYFVSRGEPEKAAKVAQRILLFDKMASQTRGQLAVQMISGGDAPNGAKVLVDAYNENIHDGSVLDVKQLPDGRYGFTVTKDGKVVQQGAGTAADLAALAGNVANGSEFTRRTARIAAGDAGAGEPPVPAPASARPGAPPAATEAAPAVPAEAVPAEASPAATPAEAAAPTTAPAEGKKKRTVAWAKKQYIYAASVLKYWDDVVARDPSPANKARLKDAQIRLGEAESDAVQIRMSTVPRTRGTDPGKIMLDFDADLAEWREAADPLEEAPPEPTGGLRGAEPAPAPAAAIPAAGAPAPAAGAPTAPVTSGGNTGDFAKFVGGGVRGGGGSYWDVGGQKVWAPPPAQLRAPEPAILEQAKQAIAAGKSRAGVIRKLLESGLSPAGL